MKTRNLLKKITFYNQETIMIIAKLRIKMKTKINANRDFSFIRLTLHMTSCYMLMMKIAPDLLN